MSDSPKTKNYAFFSHKECEYFPCHKGADPENFNCLFCYCPLYVLGDRCGGNFKYLPNGFKSCMNCQFPHKKENYDRILSRYQEILDTMSSLSRNRSVSEGSTLRPEK